MSKHQDAIDAANEAFRRRHETRIQRARRAAANVLRNLAWLPVAAVAVGATALLDRMRTRDEDDNNGKTERSVSRFQ